jgi:hypothetical protein
MTRSSIVAAVVVTLLLGLLLWWRDERSPFERTKQALTPSSTVRRPRGEVTAVPAARSTRPDMGPSLAPTAAEPPPYEPLPMTEEMREQRRRVLDSPGARRQPASGHTPASSEARASVNGRKGKLRPEVKALRLQLIPVAEHCFAQAKRRGVHQRGMLAIEVTVAGAKGIGRIIETVEPAAGNAIDDPELIDCVRQSAFALALPPPASSGSSEALLTIPFEGAADASAPISR